MSEPTYRVELEHRPGFDLSYPWHAHISRYSDGEQLKSLVGSTREAAFERAQAWVRAMQAAPESSSIVLLTEDGDILDPHEVQR